MPGFPIRTSSDHSSVDSSPRLIAASYVLHRLLMPRHPPYALNNLLQRCSHPLCSSQTPTRKPWPSRRHLPRMSPPSRFARGPDPGTETHNPTMGCCLRTQQCADTYSNPAPLTPLSTLTRRSAVLVVFRRRCCRTRPVVSTAYERHPPGIR
jgi:hypothetical protein